MPKVQKESSVFEVPQAGSQAAVIVRIADLCTHDEVRNQGKPNEEVKPTRKVYFAYELADRKADGSPFVLTTSYTLSLNEKATLTKVVKAATGSVPEDGEYFDVNKELAGKAVMVNVEVKTKDVGGQKKTFAQVKDVLPLPRGMQAPVPATDIQTWDLGEPAPDWSDWPRLFGKKVEDVIASSYEVQEANAAQPA